jgi:hypothetical protein
MPQAAGWCVGKNSQKSWHQHKKRDGDALCSCGIDRLADRPRNSDPAQASKGLPFALFHEMYTLDTYTGIDTDAEIPDERAMKRHGRL